MSVERTASVVDLSVVVVTLGRGEHLMRCLQALEGQTSAPEMEVIVPHDDRLQHVDRLRGRFPGIRFLHFPGQHSYAGLRAKGVGMARGAVVALTEDHCIPPKSWCANIVAAHAEPHAAIGGPIEKYEPDTALNWAVYLRDFGSYMPPQVEGPAGSLSDCNVSYKRRVVEAIREVWSEEFHETQIHTALHAQGETFWLCPEMVVFEQRSVSLGPAVTERYEFGRVYGRLRAGTVSTLQRLLLIAASPFLPALLVVRVLLETLGRRRHVRPCLRAFPYLILLVFAWSGGELMGYLAGPMRHANWERSPMMGVQK